MLALDEVSFAVAEGSCHALMGENGAGKSTMGKILAGVYTADSGQLVLRGTPIHPHNPLAARKLGISMVHQELAFCPNLSISENLCLGQFPSRAGWVDRDEMRRRAAAMLSEIGSDLDVDLPIERLTTGQEQIVQIAAAVGTGARIIVMDEPTSSLSAHESEHLFHLIGHLKERRITIIYVSHRMEEIFRLCDHITVLRDGRHVSTAPISSLTPDAVVHQMIGRELAAWQPKHLDRALGSPVLEVEGLSSPGKFQDVGFMLHPGEMLGLAGLVGAGRSETAQAIFGLDGEASGIVRVNGTALEPGSVPAALAAGIGLVPEDRKRQGLVLSMNCRENASLAALEQVSSAGWVRPGAEASLVARFAERLRVKTPSWESPIAGLSGGNQQKIALIKWLARQSRILIVDEPTRGVDVGAKAEIHQLLDELACEGIAILLISSELPEIMNLSRRIVVFREGRITGTLQRSEFSQAALLRLMAGV